MTRHCFAAVISYVPRHTVSLSLSLSLSYHMYLDGYVRCRRSDCYFFSFPPLSIPLCSLSLPLTIHSHSRRGLLSSGLLAVELHRFSIGHRYWLLSSVDTRHKRLRRPGRPAAASWAGRLRPDFKLEGAPGPRACSVRVRPAAWLRCWAGIGPGPAVRTQRRRWLWRC